MISVVILVKLISCSAASSGDGYGFHPSRKFGSKLGSDHIPPVSGDKLGEGRRMGFLPNSTVVDGSCSSGNLRSMLMQQVLMGI